LSKEEELSGRHQYRLIDALFARLRGGRLRERSDSARYRRARLDERLLVWRLATRGVGARRIARLIARDHHTVLRHRKRESGEDLALSLASVDT
jgi:hypothetical protein